MKQLACLALRYALFAALCCLVLYVSAPFILGSWMK